MTIMERAQIIPDEAKTNHLMLDDKWDGHFTAADISDAYVAGANDVRTLVLNKIFKCRTSSVSAAETLDAVCNILIEI